MSRLRGIFASMALGLALAGLSSPRAHADEIPFAVEDFCPLYLYTVSNGVYYFYAQDCKYCNYALVSDTRNHTIDSGCMGCNYSTHCTDPVRAITAGRPVNGALQGLTPSLKERLDHQDVGYIPPRAPAGAPGSSREKAGLFQVAANVDLIGDDVAVLNREGERPRLFRLFIARLTEGPGTDEARTLAVGQELDPTHPDLAPAATYLSATLKDSLHPRMHTIEAGAGANRRSYLVISRTPIE